MKLDSSIGKIDASEVRPNQVIVRYIAKGTEILSGFYARLVNPIGPSKSPVKIGIRINNQSRHETVSIPVFGTLLRNYTKTNGKAKIPLDVGQEYRVALHTPLRLKKEDTVNLEIREVSFLQSGILAGLQFQGTWNLFDGDNPFRPMRLAGPVCNVTWSERECIVTGNQIKLDPLCAPQNNSGVILDLIGNLYQFNAFYSVDEQYGGGRKGSISRIFGFRRKANSKMWETLGLIVDAMPDFKYAGDPYVFYDLDGIPCIAFDMADGTEDFSDCKRIWGSVIRSQSQSWEGPWGPIHHVWAAYPKTTEEDRTICPRIYPRPKTKDYILLWQHGTGDICIRGAILPDLNAILSHEQIRNAPILARNQEEGGGGFIIEDKGYLSTWQIPSINDPTGIQRLYEFDLADPLNPEKWHVVPGSWGWNQGNHPLEDGGMTADAWSLSYDASLDRLYATMVVWSVSLQKNSILTCYTLWKQRFGKDYFFGVPRVPKFDKIAPVVEYALSSECRLRTKISALSSNAPIILAICPNDGFLLQNGTGLEVDPQGIRLVGYSKRGDRSILRQIPIQNYSVKQNILELSRQRDSITGNVNGQQIGPVKIPLMIRHQWNRAGTRFRFYVEAGMEYAIHKLVLVDGPCIDDSLTRIFMQETPFDIDIDAFYQNPFGNDDSY